MKTKRMMLGLLILFALVGCTPPTAGRQVPAYQLERVVVLMRHGLRTQTDSRMLARESGHAWPVSSKTDGQLTDHGAQGVADQMRWQLNDWRRRGLRIEDGCPEHQIMAWSSAAQRARETGNAGLDGMFPGCGLHVRFSQRAKDPVMKGHKVVRVPLNTDKVVAQVIAAAGGSLDTVAKHYQADVARLKEAVCKADACRFLDEPWGIKVHGGKVSFTGPLKYAANMEETIRLQYSEGLPLDQVAFGHVRDAADVKALMGLHQARFELMNDTPELARHGGSALMALLQRAVAAEDTATDDPVARPLVMLFGHDTNISQIRTMLGFDWQMAGAPYNDIPPGAALVFERYRGQAGSRDMVRVSLQARSMDQWRALTPITDRQPLQVAEWRFPGCDDTPIGVLCPMEDVVARMAKEQDPALPVPESYLAPMIPPLPMPAPHT